MRVLTIDVPHLGNRTHLVHDGRVGVVIDPPRDPEPVEKAAADAGIDLVAVAETHIHNDYVSGGLCLSKRHGAEYLLAADEDVEFARIGVRDNETLAFGDIDLRVIATPGHTPLHLSYLATDATAGGNAAGRPVQRRQPVARDRRAHRPDRPEPHHRADPRAVAHRAAAGRTARRDDPAPDPRLRQLLRQQPRRLRRRTTTIGAQRADHPALTTARDTFVEQLLEGLGPVPSHYAHMAGRNRRGAWTPRPGTRLDADQVGAASARGAHVVDLRSSEAYAAGHLPGSLAVPAGPQCAVYVGWITPWGGELVLVSDSTVELEATERELAGVGIEAVETAVLDADLGARRRVPAHRLDGLRERRPGSRRRRARRTTPRRVAGRTPRRRPQHRRARPAPPAPRDPAGRGVGALRRRLPRDRRSRPARPRRSRRRAGRRRLRAGPRARNPLAAWAIRRLTGCTTPDM